MSSVSTEFTLDRFGDNGFAFLGRVASDQELDTLRAIFRNVAGGQVRSVPGRTAVEVDDHARQVNLQIRNPEQLWPGVADGLRNLRDRLRQAAAVALADEARDVGSAELICRPPGVGRATDWHQDEAFMSPRLVYRRATVWVAVVDTDEESGCMSFVPGSHRGRVLVHRVAPEPALAEPVDLGGAIRLPLKAGEATIHHCRTLHRVGPNRSTRYRVAYLNRFEAPGLVAAVPDRRPWLAVSHAGQRETT